MKMPRAVVSLSLSLSPPLPGALVRGFTVHTCTGTRKLLHLFFVSAVPTLHALLVERVESRCLSFSLLLLFPFQKLSLPTVGTVCRGQVRMHFIRESQSLLFSCFLLRTAGREQHTLFKQVMRW